MIYCIKRKILEDIERSINGTVLPLKPYILLHFEYHPFPLQSSDTDSQFTPAPSDIYRSPLESPTSLSNVDMLLDSNINKYDLRKQMEATMGLLRKRGTSQTYHQCVLIMYFGVYNNELDYF